MSTFPFDVQYNNGYSVKRADNNRRVDPLHGLSFSMPRYSNPRYIVSLSFTFNYTEMETFWDFYDANIDIDFLIPLNISGTIFEHTASFIDYPSVQPVSAGLYSVSLMIAAKKVETTLSGLMRGYSGFCFDFTDESKMWQDTGGTTPVTANGQTIARIDSTSDTVYSATQATAANRPTYVKTGTLGYGYSVSTDRLAIASSAATFKWAHSGDPMTAFAVYRPSVNANGAGVMGSGIRTANSIGFGIYGNNASVDPALSSIYFVMERGITSSRVYNLSSLGQLTLSDFYLHVFNVGETGSPGVAKYYKDNTFITSQSPLNSPPSTADATYDMELFGTGGNRDLGSNQIVFCGLRSSPFSSTELTVLNNIAQEKIALL